MRVGSQDSHPSDEYGIWDMKNERRQMENNHRVSLRRKGLESFAKNIEMSTDASIAPYILLKGLLSLE